ncbi:MAG: transcription-repair coupling factor, partial [Anaerotignaceae bacterium]
MRGLLEPLNKLSGFTNLIEDLKNKNTPLLLTGVIDVQISHMIGAVGEKLNVPSLIIAENDLKAKEICEDLRFFNKNTVYYPSKDFIFYSAHVHSRETDRQRAMVINKILKGERPNVVISIEALFDRRIKPEVFKKHIIKLEEGQIINIDDLAKSLILLGYERTELVEGAGQFSIRGGIVDVFSPVMDTAIRIEFWDEEIDSIRTMDTYSQRSIEKLTKAELFPFSEVVYGEEELKNALSLMEKDYKKAKAVFEKKELFEECEKLQEHIGEVIEQLKEKNHISKCEAFIEYFYNDTVSFLNYMPEDTVVFYNEPHRIKEQAKTVFMQFSESIKSRIEKGYMLKKEADLIFTYDHILKMASSYNQVVLATITKTVPEFRFKNIISMAVKGTSAFNNRTDLFYEEVVSLKNSGYITVILTGSQSKAERIVRELMENNIVAGNVENLKETTLSHGAVFVARGSLSKGFEYTQIKLAVFSDHELFDEKTLKKVKRRKKTGKAIESFTDLKVGDYVVHQAHGIGVFRGLEKIVVDNVNKDYLKISYADGGSLFLPVNQMDAIQKYIGADNSVKLNKLGGQEWNKAKAKVRAAVTILAEDLIALYAKRQASVGYRYSPDNLWQKEFEETFPYVETDDQLTAIEDVKKDMESEKVMDRLVCGDVGYGKTEVAIRAAFKAVQDGKQVAYLVPTTILAQQHYNTFCERMKDYPIKIGLLSRFRTAKQQKETLKELETGFVDIVIGTHRILSKDVVFKNLGMVIIDEEQRFGVAHKEKMKTLKENVDILTLTATPIPRTLHMSLSGIRDMSILEEPPQERHPVQTYVLEKDPEFIRDAITRELNRGGQVYYLYNRVETISQEAFKVQQLVPEANVAYAHGQMSERELEIIMKAFIDGEIDVLVCTTIIETGLDISNANTMIIQDADRMGLSQLYQLRGRVGRSNRIAYAYLCYKKDKVLNEISEKRLQTIKEFTEFGSGFKIAMRDLEIRGAGNLLGGQQHGHMDTVGYDMYCKLLDEAVKQLQG